jgi:hypothetical protein
MVKLAYFTITVETKAWLADEKPKQSSAKGAPKWSPLYCLTERKYQHCPSPEPYDSLTFVTTKNSATINAWLLRTDNGYLMNRHSNPFRRVFSIVFLLNNRRQKD